MIWIYGNVGATCQTYSSLILEKLRIHPQNEYISTFSNTKMPHPHLVIQDIEFGRNYDFFLN